jgi:RNA polymerase sigma-32 factor
MAQTDDPHTQKANLRFIRTAMNAPLLSRDHEQALARQWREESDEAALHALTAAHARLVIAVASRYRNYGLPLGDLVQEGNVGLMQAAARFEHARDVRFSTYAAWWIRSAVQDFVLRNWSIVRTGTTSSQKTLFFNFRRLRARIEAAGVAPFDDEGRRRISTELSVPISEVVSMEQRLAAADQSLNAPIGDDGTDEWQDSLADQRPSPESVVIGARDAATRSRWLAEAIGALSPRERTIIHRRRLSDAGATLEELGRQLGVSKERVRQLEHRALGKLRDSMLRHVAVPDDLMTPV